MSGDTLGDSKPPGQSRWAQWRTGLLWTTAVLLLAVLLVRTFFFDVYRVTSTSMEPSLIDGEWVLVLYDSSVPRRNELVVLSHPEGEEPLVKRVAGLPEESVQIVRGDCLIDGRRLPIEDGRPGPFVVIDDVHDLVPELNLGYGGRWSQNEGVFEVDAVALDRADPAGLAFSVPDINDEYIKNGERVRGTHEVNDLELSGEVWIEGPVGRARFGVNEMGDDFWVEFELSADDVPARARLLRTSIGDVSVDRDGAREAFEGDPAPELEELLAVDVELDPGRWHGVRLANVDNVLRAWLDDELVLRVSYDANRFAPTDAESEGRSPSARLWFGADGTRARFRGLEVRRDVYYTGRGQYGHNAPEQLGPDEIFVLGDNSAQSQDSREWGPVSLERVLGRPVWVMWPPSAWRRL